MAASLGTQLQDWFVHLPLATRSITALCCGIYVAGLFLGHEDISVCIYPPNVVINSQVYRLLTAGFFHVGLLHLVMNMFAFQALAPSLERSMGSFTFTYLVVLFQVVSSFMNTLVSLVLFKTGIYTGAWNQCTVGLSSVLFAFLVLRSHAQQSHNMSLFGFASVPAQWYPWVLLIFFQLIMPQVSFLGHLTGMLVAYLHVWGKLEMLKLPSETINRIEASSYLGWLVAKDGYITNTQFGVGGAEETLPTSYRQVQPVNPSTAGSSSSSSGVTGFFQKVMGTNEHSPGSTSTSTQTQLGASMTSGSSTSTSNSNFVAFSGKGYALGSG